MPQRLAKLIPKLRAFGITVEPASKHFKAWRGEGRAYTIPAHNGTKTELPDKYIKGLCKHFDLDPKELID